MKIATFQAKFRAANRPYNTYAEKVRLNTELRRELKGDPLKGAVFTAVCFGSGASDGFVDLVMRAKSLSRKAAKDAISAAEVATSHGIAYSDAEIAALRGESMVGMGSCTNYRVVEMDADAPEAPDISAAEGAGWWMEGTKNERLESLAKGE